MKNRKTRSAMRRMLFTLALVLVVAVASVGGTIAWLTDKTDAVTNTFTTANIDIDLTETWNAMADENSTDYDTWNAKLVPGKEYAKDPKVTVNAGSEACWLFVHVAEANNEAVGLTGKVVDYTVHTEWTPVPNHTGFFYREVDATTAAAVSYYVLTGNTTNPNGFVKINENLTKEQEEAFGAHTPTITVTAAAVQKDGVADVAAAWDKLPSAFTSGT